MFRRMKLVGSSRTLCRKYTHTQTLSLCINYFIEHNGDDEPHDLEFFFWGGGAFGKFRNSIMNSMSVHPSAWNSSAPTVRISMKFDT